MENRKKAIGGYLGLELGESHNNNPHGNASALNTGRNAFYCILSELKPKSILLPNFLCKAILDPVHKLNIPYRYYSVSSTFEPIVHEDLSPTTYLLYINYFGICDNIVNLLAENYSSNLIVDNTQAFFSDPIDGIPTFYSARKFFGVPDGGYLYGVDINMSTLQEDQSWNRCKHLLIREDISPEEGYSSFQENERLLSIVEVAKMSRLTNSILNAINYREVKAKRIQNFEYLHSKLITNNELSNIFKSAYPSISYPYLTANAMSIREELKEQRIFTPMLWDNTMMPNIPFDDNQFAERILHLPIDQRYTSRDLARITKILI